MPRPGTRLTRYDVAQAFGQASSTRSLPSALIAYAVLWLVRQRVTVENIWAWLLRDESKVVGSRGFLAWDAAREVPKPRGYRGMRLMSPGLGALGRPVSAG